MCIQTHVYVVGSLFVSLFGLADVKEYDALTKPLWCGGCRYLSE